MAERAQDTPTHTSYLSQFFLLDQTRIFTRRNSFFLQQEAGVSICMRTPFVTPLVRHKINGMYWIFLSGVSDFWKSFLFVSATKNLVYPIFFIRYIRFVLIRNLFLFEDPRYRNIMPGSSQKIKLLILDIHECKCWILI